MDRDLLDRLTHEIYGAALDDAAWTGLAERLSQDLFGGPVAIDHQTATQGVTPFVVDFGLDPVAILESLRLLESEHIGLMALRRATDLAPFKLETFVDAKTLKNDLPTRAFFEPQRLDKGLFVRFQSDLDHLSYVSLFRRADQEAFDADHVGALTRIAAHLARAVSLRELRLEKERNADLLRQLSKMEQRPRGVLVVDHQLRVIDLDHETSTLLTPPSPLRVAHGRLCVAPRCPDADTDELAAYLRNAGADVASRR